MVDNVIGYGFKIGVVRSNYTGLTHTASPIEYNMQIVIEIPARGGDNVY